MKTKAILFSAPGQVELREVTVPEPEPDEVLIKTAFTCISPGTELRVLAGLEEARAQIEDPEALSGLVRRLGLVPAVRALVDSLG